MVKTPQKNARVECKHRHILNVARALRFQSSLPTDFWGECVLTAAHLINRTPTRVLEGKTPFELLFGKPANLNLLRTFGCLAYAKNFNPIDKFDSRSRKCVFLGYPFGKKGWHLYDLETGSYFQSRDVSFIENNFPYAHQTEEGSLTFSSTDGEIVPDDEPQAVPVSPQLVHIGTGSSATGTVHGSVENGYNSKPIEHVQLDTTADATDEITAGPDCNSQENGSEAEVILGRGKREKIPNKNHQDFVSWDCIDTSLEESPTANSVSGSAYPLTQFVNYEIFSRTHQHFLSALTKDIEPKSFKEAMGDAR
ncbi:uncharacterized protein LOC141640708 [Silene latifolia]|uniref:uncharacterized protein LOC141640708 n=1 Tax=Silene latifolia TaxID=37657 RepID=UPI003D76EE00